VRAAHCITSEFLADLSHAIRTPLHGIFGLADLALDTALTADQREFLDLIKTCAQDLRTAIYNLLDFFETEARDQKAKAYLSAWKSTL
jgi:signal transduction histidine kinase